MQSDRVLLQIKSLLSSMPANDVSVVPAQTNQTETVVTQSNLSETPVTPTDLSKKEKFSKLLEFFLSLENGEALIEKMFSERITVDTIFELWDSEICDTKCVDFFCANYNKLTTDEFIKRINFRIICLISGSEKLALEENEIFSLVSRWIKLTKPDDAAKKEVLSNIRFPLIKPIYLAGDVKKSGLFSETELLEAFEHQTVPTKRPELRFQGRDGCDCEIYLGLSFEEYPNYRRVLNQDIEKKGFRKSLIASLKKTMTNLNS